MDNASVYLIASIMILGLCIGSFLNVCIYRLPNNQSIIRPRSFCSSCNTSLKISEMVPVFSYVFLQGSCRHCGTRISPRYLIIEVLTSALFSLLYIKLGITIEILAAMLLTVFLIVITFIDIDHQLILDKVLIWFAGAGIVINLLTDRVSIMDMATASLLGGGLLLIIAIATRGGMGGGDVKFVAALGLWLGLKLTILTIFLSFVIGGIGGALLLAFKIKSRKDFIPFGPYIAIGAFISILYGDMIIRWYLRSFI